MRGLNNILFSRSTDFIHIVQMIQPANSASVPPVQPNQLDSCGHHLIPMAI
jgi:hypothetical protein